MHVDRIMSRSVITVTRDTRLAHMVTLMRENSLRHLPVVDEAHELVGLVSQRDIQRAAPSSITTLSVGEVNYLVSKITAGQIMTAEVVTCTPDTLVEDAALTMRQSRIACLPVVEGRRLVGLVTTTDLLDFFLDITGCTAPDTARIAVHLPDATGALGTLLDRINDFGGYIATVVSPMKQDETGMRVVIIRYRHANPDGLDAHLRQAGYDIVSEDLPGTR